MMAVALPILAITLSGCSIALLLGRLADEIRWARHPSAIHTARTPDRALALITATAACLIAISLWRIS